MNEERCPNCPHLMREHVATELFFGIAQLLGCRHEDCECEVEPDLLQLIP